MALMMAGKLFSQRADVIDVRDDCVVVFSRKRQGSVKVRHTDVKLTRLEVKEWRGVVLKNYLLDDSGHFYKITWYKQKVRAPRAMDKVAGVEPMRAVINARRRIVRKSRHVEVKQARKLFRNTGLVTDPPLKFSKPQTREQRDIDTPAPPDINQPRK